MQIKSPIRIIAFATAVTFSANAIILPTYSGDIKSAKLAPESRFAAGSVSQRASSVERSASQRNGPSFSRMTAAFSGAGLADKFRRMADTLLPRKEEPNIFKALPEGEVGVIEIGMRRLNKEFFERMINSNPDILKQATEYARVIKNSGSRINAELAQLKLTGNKVPDGFFKGKVSELEYAIIAEGVKEKWFSLAEVMRRVRGRNMPPAKVVVKAAPQIPKKEKPVAKPKKALPLAQPKARLSVPKAIEDEFAFLDKLDNGIAAPENKAVPDEDARWLKDFISGEDKKEKEEADKTAAEVRLNGDEQKKADDEWDAALKARLGNFVAEVEAEERRQQQVEAEKQEAELAKRAEIERAHREAEEAREKEKTDLDNLLREFRENVADQKRRLDGIIERIEVKDADKFIDSTLNAIDKDEVEAGEFIDNLIKDIKAYDAAAREAYIRILLEKKNFKMQVLQALFIEVNRHRNEFSDVKDIAGRIENLKSKLVEASQALVVSAAEKKNIVARIASNKEGLARMAEGVRKALGGLRQLSGRIEALNVERMREKEFGKVHRDLRDELLTEQGKRQRKDALLKQKDTRANGIFDEQANLEKGLSGKEEEIKENIDTLERLLDEEVMAIRQEAGHVVPEMAEKTDEMIVAGVLEKLEKEKLAPQDRETDSVVGETEDAFHRNNDLADGIGRSLKRGELDSKTDEAVAGKMAWIGALDKLIVASKGGGDRERLRSLRDRIDSACDEIAGDRAELEKLRNRLKNELMLMLEALKRARRIEEAQAQRRAQMEENKKRLELEMFEKALREDRAALQRELNELNNLKHLEDERMERLKSLEALMNERKKNIEKNTTLLGELTQQVDSENRRKEEEETREEEGQISSETDAIEKALGEEAGSKEALRENIRKILLKKNEVPDWGSFKAEFITLLREVRENIQNDAKLDTDLIKRGPKIKGIEQGIKSRVEGIRYDIDRRGVKERIRFGRKFTELDEAEKNARRSGLKSGLCDEVERANVERVSARNRWKTKIKDVITTISEADEAGFGQARRELVKLRGVAKDTKAWADEDGRRLTDLSEQERLLSKWNAEIDRIEGTVLADEAETKEPTASTPQLQATGDLLKKRERIAEMLSKLLEIPDGPFDISLGNPVKNLDKRRWLLPFSPARIKGLLSRNPGALLPALSGRFIYDLLSEIESKKQGSDEASTRRGYYREAGIDGELQERIEGFLREFGTAKDAHKGSRDDIAMEVALRLGITDAKEVKRIKDLFVGFDGKLRRAIEYIGYEDRDSERDVLTELVAGIGSVAARTEEARIKFRRFLEEHKDNLTPSLIVIEGIGQMVPLAVTGKSGWLTRMISDCESLIRKQSNVSTPTRERDYPSLELNDDERERLLSIIFGMQAQDLLFGEMGSIESLFGPARKVNMGWVRDALDFIKGSREAEETGEYRKFKKDCVRQYKLSQKEAVVDRLYLKVRAMDGLALDLLEDYLERILKCPKSPVFVSGDVIKVLVLGASEDITQGACLDMWKKEFGDDGKAMMEFAREEGYSELITRLRNALRVDVEGETVFPSKAMLIEVLQIVLVGQKQDLNAVVRGLKPHLLKLKKRIAEEYRDRRSSAKKPALPHLAPINEIKDGASRTAALAPASRFGDVPARVTLINVKDGESKIHLKLLEEPRPYPNVRLREFKYRIYNPQTGEYLAYGMDYGIRYYDKACTKIKCFEMRDIDVTPLAESGVGATLINWLVEMAQENGATLTTSVTANPYLVRIYFKLIKNMRVHVPVKEVIGEDGEIEKIEWAFKEISLEEALRLLREKRYFKFYFEDGIPNPIRIASRRVDEWTEDVARGQNKKTNKQGISLRANLAVCLAVAAFNSKTGERAMAHFLPTGHQEISQEESVMLGEAKEVYLERILKDIKGGDWQVTIVSSEGSISDSAISERDILPIELRGYLVNRNSVDQTKVTMYSDMPEGISWRRVTINDKGEVKVDEMKDMPQLDMKAVEDQAKKLFATALNHHMNQKFVVIYDVIPYIKKALESGKGFEDKDTKEAWDDMERCASGLKDIISLIEGIVNPVDTVYQADTMMLDLENSNKKPNVGSEQDQQIREAKLKAIDELRKPLIAEVNKVLPEIEKEIALLKEGKLDKAAALEALDRIREVTETIEDEVKAINGKAGLDHTGNTRRLTKGGRLIQESSRCP